MRELYLQMEQYEYAMVIAEALKDNRALKSFELRVWKGGDRLPLLEVYEEMLQHNSTIEQLIIDSGGPGTLNATIEFYLRLNRAGRQRLIVQSEEVPRKEWIDFLIPHKNDLRVIFYIISLNPSLCQCVDIPVVRTGQGRQNRRTGLCTGNGRYVPSPKRQKV
jgi:hypothetical protein